MAAPAAPKAVVTPTPLPPVSIQGMSHERLLVKLLEVTEQNMQLIRSLYVCKQKLKISEAKVRETERRLVATSLHPALRRSLAHEGKLPKAIVRYA